MLHNFKNHTVFIKHSADFGSKSGRNLLLFLTHTVARFAKVLALRPSFYKSCEGTLSPSNLYSSHTLDFKTSEARLVSHKAKACSLWNPLRGITIAPHHKCATLHKTGRVRVSTCFVPFMPACGFTLSYKFLRK